MKKNLNLRDLQRLTHIVESCEYAAEIVATSKDNITNQLALERIVEIIGEAANQVSEEIKAKYDKIEWRKIIDTRNILAHEYHRVDADIVWNICKNKLPKLKIDVQKIIEELENE